MAQDLGREAGGGKAGPALAAAAAPDRSRRLNEPIALRRWSAGPGRAILSATEGTRHGEHPHDGDERRGGAAGRCARSARRARLRPGRLRPGRLLPGIGLCAAVTALAAALQFVEIRLAGEPYLEALVLAILIGVAVRTAWTPGPLWAPGIAFSAKILLELAVVMLGASVSAAAVLALGPALIGGIALVVAVAIGSSYGICRLLGLPRRMAVLVACGNSICGNSAIAAVAPVIGADGDDVASSIAFTAVLGVVTVLVLPLLVPLLRMTLTQYGVLAGLTVYAVPQVLAATLPIGALSNQVGTVVKLVRVLMLGPVVLGLSLAGPRCATSRTRPRRRSPRATGRVPACTTSCRGSSWASCSCCRSLARPDPARGAAAHRRRGQPAHHPVDGGAGPRRRRPGGGQGGAAGRRGRHGVAARPGRDRVRPDPGARRGVTAPSRAAPTRPALAPRHRSRYLAARCGAGGTTARVAGPARSADRRAAPGAPQPEQGMVSLDRRAIVAGIAAATWPRPRRARWRRRPRPRRPPAR